MGVPYPVKVFRDYLEPLLEDTRVATLVPASRPRRLVVIETAPANAHAKPDYLSWRRLVFKTSVAGDRCTVTASDQIESYELCERVRGHVLASRFASVGVRAVAIVGEPADFPDPDDSTPRFQLTADVLMRVTP